MGFLSNKIWVRIFLGHPGTWKILPWHHHWRIFPTRHCASHSVNNRRNLTWNRVKIHASPTRYIPPTTQERSNYGWQCWSHIVVLHHHRASPMQINAVETDNVTCQQLILFYWSRTPWYNMDRVWFDKLAANTELVNTYNIFSSLSVIYLRITLTFHFIYSRSLIKYTKSRTRGIFHT